MCEPDLGFAVLVLAKDHIHGSAPPIGRVRVRAHEQRYVVVLSGSVDHELDDYLGEEGSETPAEEIVLDVEDKPVPAYRKLTRGVALAGMRRILGPRLLRGGPGRSDSPHAQPPVPVGTPGCHRGPARTQQALNPDRDVPGRPAGGGVQDVGRHTARLPGLDIRLGHVGSPPRSLRSRRPVILRSSSRTIFASVSASLPSRARKAVSISAALRPVAQIRNTWPNRSSYVLLPAASAARVSALASDTPACS